MEAVALVVALRQVIDAFLNQVIALERVVWYLVEQRFKARLLVVGVVIDGLLLIVGVE